MAQASVAATYRHQDKICTAGDFVCAGQARLKWYDIAAASSPTPDPIRDMARAFVKALDLPEELGFVILHRCGDSFYFLLVQTWRGENELWESVYAKQSDADPGFAAFPQPNVHRGTFCVWELGAVLAEKQAWIRFLRSPRGEADERTYLADRFSGVV